MAKPNKKRGSKTSPESLITLATAIINLMTAIILLMVATR